MILGTTVQVAGVPLALVEPGPTPAGIAALFRSGLLPVTPPADGQAPLEYLRAALQTWALAHPGNFTLSLNDPDTYLDETLEYGTASDHDLDHVRGARGDVLAVLDPPRCEVFSARRFLRRMARASNRLGPQVVAALERASMIGCPVFGPKNVIEYLEMWDPEVSWRDMRDAVARERAIQSGVVTREMLRAYLDEHELYEPDRAQRAVGKVVTRALRRTVSVPELRVLAGRLPEAEAARVHTLLSDIERLSALGEALLPLGGEATSELFRATCASFPTPAFVLDVTSAEELESSNRWGRVQEVLEEDYQQRMSAGENPPPALALLLSGDEDSARNLRRAVELMTEAEALTRSVVRRIHDWT